MLITGQCGGGRNYIYGNEPEFTEPLKNITVQMGRNATFTCHISGIENKGFRVSMLWKDTEMFYHNALMMINNTIRFSEVPILYDVSKKYQI